MSTSSYCVQTSSDCWLTTASLHVDCLVVPLPSNVSVHKQDKGSLPSLLFFFSSVSVQTLLKILCFTCFYLVISLYPLVDCNESPMTYSCWWIFPVYSRCVRLFPQSALTGFGPVDLENPVTSCLSHSGNCWRYTCPRRQGWSLSIGLSVRGSNINPVGFVKTFTKKVF